MRRPHWRTVSGMIAAGLATHTVCLAADPPPADPPPADPPSAGRRSSYAIMAPETRAMQDDDTANPGMLSVLDGAALWTAKAGKSNSACSDCHQAAEQSMAGVAARYPAFDARRGAAVNLEGRIDACRTEQQQAPALGHESQDMLALTAYIGRQSRGLPIVSDQARLASTIAAGRTIYERRQGQLNLSCAQCHDDNAGQKLAGITIPEAHPTGYPLYRLEWQSLGSLQRRLRNCLSGMRAESYPFGAPELVALETFLMWRARGLALETPAVRP